MIVELEKICLQIMPTFSSERERGRVGEEKNKQPKFKNNYQKVKVN